MKLTSAQKLKFRRMRNLSQMKKMDPIEFEHFVGWLYQKKGYRVGTTVTSGDEGIDLTLHRWGRRTVVQVKRYKGTVGQPVVRDLYGAMVHTGAREAHVVTTGRFSRQAEAWAAGKPIALIDGNDLVAWVNKGHRLKAKAKGKQVYFMSPFQIAVLVVFIAGILLTSLWYWDKNFRSDNTPAPVPTITIPYPAPNATTQTLPPPLPTIQPTATPTVSISVTRATATSVTPIRTPRPTATQIIPISVTLVPAD